MVEYAAGSTTEVTQHDGSIIRLRKLDQSYDPTDRLAAMAYLQERRAAGEIVTGLLYIKQDTRDLNERLNTVDVPLNSLGVNELCPGAGAIEGINVQLR
jgi:2-oxoglutarate/2-oxoacid ferredoxin oxidoreductase subunit beta